MEAFNWDFVYSFRGLVQDHHCGTQTGMVLEQELRP